MVKTAGFMAPDNHISVFVRAEWFLRIVFVTVGEDRYAQKIPPPSMLALFSEMVLFVIVGDE